MRGNDPSIALAKVDCTEAGKETCAKFSVQGYPTLKIFKNGEVSQEYNGPREAAGIVKYMKAQVGPASKDLLSLASAKEFLAIQDSAIVGFFEKESDLKLTFMKFADGFREKHRFAHTSAKEVLSEMGETDAILLYRAPQLGNKFEPDFVKFTGESKADLDEFIKGNIYGLVGHRTRENSNDFKNPIAVAYFNVDYLKNPKGTNYWRNRVLKVAKALEGKITFAISSKDEFQHELNEYGYDYTGDKPLILARNKLGQKFIMKDDFAVESLQKFAEDLLADKIEAFVKSEPIPEDNNGPVVVAVGKNFDDVVTNADKDSLIEFYAPWCGHCKKLTPIYDEVGEKLKEESGVQLVKMDATANDVPPQFEVRGFPTLFWLPKNDKKNPVKYDGGREADDFMKYIAKQATDELKGYDRSGKPKKTEL